jgi:ribose-phosphate pyrophosphokinase
VEGKNVVIVDDMIDTAGTLTKAAEVLMEKRSKKRKGVCDTCRFLRVAAYDRIANSKLTEVIVSDTIPLTSDPNKDRSKIRVASLARHFWKNNKKSI